MHPNAYTTETFIAACHIKHNHRYDYQLVDYHNQNSMITIICPEHGNFTMLAGNHLVGHECQKCSYEQRGLKRRKTKEDWITHATAKHGQKYDYSLVEEVETGREKVWIRCQRHGPFHQNWFNHCSGQGCPKCASYGRYSEAYFEQHRNIAEQPAQLYLLKFYDESEYFFKIGITKRSVAKRFAYKRGYKYKIIALRSGTLLECYRKEQEILKDLIYMNRYTPKRLLGGDRECFIDNEVLVEVINRLL